MVVGTHAKVLKSLLLLMTTILLFPSLASAQGAILAAPKPGDYEFVFVDAFDPTHPPGVVVPPPSLAGGITQIRVVPRLPETPSCVVVVEVFEGWCISPGGLITNAYPPPGGAQPVVSGFWTKYPDGKALIEAQHGGPILEGGGASNHLTGMATPISPVKVFITGPRAGTTVSGTNLWVTMWAEGTTGSANVFTLSADGKQVGVANVGSSKGPATIFWNMTGVPKGAHTLKADVRDAAGDTGSTTLSFILQ